MAEMRPSRKIADREDEYHARRFNRIISPERVDAFSENNNTSNARSYSDVMKEAELEREQQRIMRSIAEKKKRQKFLVVLQLVLKFHNQKLKKLKREDGI